MAEGFELTVDSWQLSAGTDFFINEDDPALARSL